MKVWVAGQLGDLAAVRAVMDVVLGAVEHDSVFYAYPHVRRVDRVEEWLAGL